MAKAIKKAKISEQVEKEKGVKAFKDDLTGYFGERDKTNRGVSGKSEDLTNQSKAEIEVKEMLYKESLKEITPPEGFGLMFSSVLVTAKRNMVKTSSGIIIAEEGVSVDCDYQEVQKIMAIGPQIKNDKDGVRVGWDIAINLNNFRDFRAAESGNMADKVNKTKVLRVPTVIINNVEYILMGDRDIKYIVNNGK
jgi:hypothetical protein